MFGGAGENAGVFLAGFALEGFGVGVVAEAFRWMRWVVFLGKEGRKLALGAKGFLGFC